MEELHAKMSLLKSQLSKFEPKLLGESDSERGYSELIKFLSLIPNGGNAIPFKSPTFCSPISKSIPDTFRDEEIYPEGHLGHYIASNQIFFGEYIQFQGAPSRATRFGAMLSLKKYGLQTGSVILDPLLELECEFILTHTFAPESRSQALDAISKKRTKLENADDLGFSQINHLCDLEDGIASETTLLGFHHNTIMLLADSIEELESAILEATKVYSYSGMVLVRETIGSELAFWAQIPGNHHFISRASLIVTFRIKLPTPSRIN